MRLLHKKSEGLLFVLLRSNSHHRPYISMNCISDHGQRCGNTLDSCASRSPLRITHSSRIRRDEQRGTAAT